MGQVQHGNTKAYRVLFDRHQQRIYGFLLRRTRDPQTTAELYQETFLKLHRARHTWRPGNNFRSWLFGIAANTAKDHPPSQKSTPYGQRTVGNGSYSLPLRDQSKAAANATLLSSRGWCAVQGGIL